MNDYLRDMLPPISTLRPGTCPGCSSKGLKLPDARIFVCTGCEGFFTTVATIEFEVAKTIIGLGQPMLANAGPEGAFYFDLDVLDPILADGTTSNRLHGWADRATKRVVQWG